MWGKCSFMARFIGNNYGQTNPSCGLLEIYRDIERDHSQPCRMANS